MDLHLNSNKKNEIIDITSKIEKIINIKNGICIIYCPHTTAGITINENYDSYVKKDIIKKIDKLIPDEHYFQHSEGNSDSHIKSTLIGNSKTIIIKNSKLVLGTWQGIFFYEFDGPRNRKVIVKFMEG